MTRSGNRNRRSVLKAGVALSAFLWAAGTLAQDTTLNGDVVVWTWTTPGKGLEAAIPAFNAAYPNVTVKVEDVGNPAIWDKITTGMAAGGIGLPDVMNIGIDYLGSYLERFPGSFADLSTMGATGLADKFAPAVWANVVGPNGEIWGIPYEVSAAAVFYRKDLFEQAGIDITTLPTWDALIDAAAKIKEKTGVPMMGIDKANTEQQAMNLWQMLVMQQSSFLFNQSGDVAVSSAPSVRAMSLIKKINDAELFVDLPGSWETLTQQATGQIPVSVLPMASWYAGLLPTIAPDMKGRWGVVYPPAVDAGGLTGAAMGGTFLNISSASKNKEAAWAFINFALGTLEGQKLVYAASGLFPGYKPLIESAEFQAPMPYYDGQNVNKLFVDELAQDLPAVNFTSDYAQGLKAQMDAQTQVLLKGADPKAALEAAAMLVADQTGRKIRRRDTPDPTGAGAGGVSGQADDRSCP